MTSPTPAIEALLAAREREWVWAQVILRAAGHGFDLCHADDRDKPADQLRLVRVSESRALAQDTAGGEFRPLKSAPNLANGWRVHAASPGELEFALNSLYPGSVADWFAAQGANPPVTHYAEFTQRQTGMYRIAAMLSPAQTVPVIRAVCAPGCCLKRRLWTVAGLATDAAETKSAIPCLEPCALLLEFARKAMRIEQQEALVTLRPEDARSALSAIEQVLAGIPARARIADVADPANLYRLRLAAEKLRAALARQPVQEEG